MKKKLLLVMVVVSVASCASVPPSPIPSTATSAASRPAPFDRWEWVQAAAIRASHAAAEAGEDPFAVYRSFMNSASNHILNDAVESQDWGWNGKGSRPSDVIFQQDRSRCLHGAQAFIAGTGADNTIVNLAAGYTGCMQELGWE